VTAAVLFDIDGTLADVDHRRPHLAGDRPDWKAFNAAIGDDQVHEPILRLARELRDAGNSIVLCTGRDSVFRQHTELWLTFNEVPCDALYMRPAGDKRKDHVVKMDLLDRILADGFKPWLVVDDRSSVVAAWRARGLTCLQCREGDF
jgi:FMN phosphatase YigB (HAD superfamily)